MSLADKITRLTSARNGIRSALARKSVDASTHGFEDFEDDIDSIPSGSGKGGEYHIVQTINGQNCSLAIRDANTFTLQDKTVTENGTVTADEGYDGLGTVVVNVSGGGGGSLVVTYQDDASEDLMQVSGWGEYVINSKHIKRVVRNGVIIYEKTSRLPDGFQEVEWIRSDGTAYILDPTMLCTAVASLKYTTKCILNANAGGRELMGFSGNATNYWGIMSGNYFEQGLSSAIGPASIGGKYLVEIDQRGDGTQKMDVYDGTGQTLIGTSTVGSAAYDSSEFAIFRLSAYASYTVRCLDLGEINMYRDGELVRQFVPCYRTSDNVIGVYELVNGTFLANAGGGSFTKGPDVA